MVQRDVQESPSAKFMNARLPGFGDNETLGKILPRHHVREDGLMRINPQTLDALLDGAYDTQIANYHVVDCRFDYEYNGGHVPGVININTTRRSAKKTVLVFHCKYSTKRPPTFAKHLRAKDRAMNNHVYPKIHYPEVYVLEGGYCEYYRHCVPCCQPQGYVTMDNPNHALSHKEDLDQVRKAKFRRTKCYTYGEGAVK
ncbi:Rhodanese-like protein [Leucogyrophana mollusca]|uniref:Rhodanese-like protein n=1 Tax=Leucogyrophana mollusca TaxID=85980 RepID=A0ACB8AXX3_9AGAM|nr:Rhodanese-like protein [Leucogyrophana mollusca]